MYESGVPMLLLLDSDADADVRYNEDVNYVRKRKRTANSVSVQRQQTHETSSCEIIIEYESKVKMPMIKFVERKIVFLNVIQLSV